MHRPESLRAVRVKFDCWPTLTDDYDTGVTALLIFIECMDIDGPDDTYLMPVPIMVADTLAELKLTPVIDDYKWSLRISGQFGFDLKGSGSSKPLLSFSSLKSLVLSSTDPSARLMRNPVYIVLIESDEEREERDYHYWRRQNPGSHFAYLEASEESDSQ